MVEPPELAHQLLEPIQVAQHDPGRLVPAPIEDVTCNGPVHAVHLLEVCRREPLIVGVPTHHVLHGDVHQPKHLVSRGLGDDKVEVHPVAGPPVRVFHYADGELGQDFALIAPMPVCGQLGRSRLDELAKGEEVMKRRLIETEEECKGARDVTGVGATDRDAAPRAPLDANQSVGFEQAKRLSDGCPAELPLLDKLAFRRKRGADREAVAENSTAQVVREEVGGLRKARTRLGRMSHWEHP